MNRFGNSFWYGVLFSGLGFFSCWLLVNNTNLSIDASRPLFTVWALLFFMLAFNVIGFAIMHMSSVINRQTSLYHRRRIRIVTTFVLVALMLLILNYSLLVLAKVLAGSQSPFVFHNGGEKILILVWLVELLIVSLLIANRSISNSLRLQKKASALQQQNNIARYVALQNQLNPHFLFNSLNTLIAEIDYDPANAVSFTRKLSDVYRYVLQSQNKILVPLEDELAFMDSYIFLHRVRLGECISVSRDIPDSCMDCKLPPLTIQLLVENVIKHNSITIAKPMVIRLNVEEDYLVVSNVINPRIDKSISGTGLKNLHDRYMLLAGRQVEVINADGVFTVKIPLVYE